MKIYLLCPDCGKVLTDRFSCPECSIVADANPYLLEMECLQCEKLLGIEITMEINLDKD